MANRYWVGGTGTWNSTNTANWSASSGGASGATVPTAADSVFFDVNSNVGTGSFVVTTEVSARPCLDLTVSGLDGAMTLAGTIGITISGNLSLPATNFTATLTGLLTFNATTSKTINTNGVSLAAPITFNGTGGTWTLQNNLTTTGAVTLTSGTLALSTYTMTVGSFVSTGAVSRTLSFGTGNMTVTGSGTAWNVSGTSFVHSGTPTVNIANNTATATTITNTVTSSRMNFNFTAGTYTLSITTGGYFNNINFTGFAGTIAMGNVYVRVYGNLNFGSTVTAITGTSSTVNFSFESGGLSTLTTNGEVVGCGIQVNATGTTLRLADAFTQTAFAGMFVTNGTLDVNNQTINAGATILTPATGFFSNLPSSTYITQNFTQVSGTVTIDNTSSFRLSCSGTYTLTAGTLVIAANQSLTVGAFSSNNTNTRSITFNTGSSIVVNGTGTVWNVAAVTGFTYTGTSNITISNNTATATTITNTAVAASAMNFNVINGTYTLSLTTGNSYNNLNFTGFAGTVAFVSTTHTMYGNLTLGASTVTSATPSISNLIWNSTSGTRTITSNGATANFGIIINGVGQTLQLADAFVQGATNPFNYNNGTLDLNNYSNSFGVFTITTGTHAIVNGTVNCATVTHTTGDLTLGTGSLLVCTGVYTFTAGTITLNNGVKLAVGSFSSSNSNVRSVAFGALGSFIEVTGSGASVWNLSVATNFGYTGTPLVKLTYSGSVATSIISALTAISFAITAGTYVLTITSGSIFQNLDFTGFSGTYAQATTTCNVFGDLTFSATMSYTTTTGALSLVNTSGTEIITTNGSTVGINITRNGVGGTSQLADSFAQTSAARFTLTNGTLNLNSQTTSIGIFTILTGTHAITNGTLTCASVTHTTGDLAIGTGYNVVCTGAYTFAAGSITINNGVTLTVGSLNSVTTSTRSIAFGTGSITTTGASTVWNVTGVTGLTFTGTSNITISNNTATAATITNTATSTSAMNFNVINGSYALTLSTGNSYRNLNFTGFAGTVALVATTHTMYGNLTLGASTTTSATAGTSTFTWNSTAGTRTITTNGATANFGIALNGVGQTLQLADAFVQGSTQTFAYTNGTIDVNSYSNLFGVVTITTGTHAIIGALTCATVNHTTGDLTVGTGATLTCTGTYTFVAGTITINNGLILSVGRFSSSQTSVRSIAFGTGSIKTTGTGAVIGMQIATNFTYTGGGAFNFIVDNPTSVAASINYVGPGATFAVVSGTYTLTVGSTNFTLLDFTGFTGTATSSVSSYIAGDMILGAGMTLSLGGTVFFQTAGVTCNITSNGVSFGGNIILQTGGAIAFSDDFYQPSGNTFTWANGTLTNPGYSVTLGAVTASGGTAPSRSFTGTLTCASFTQSTTAVISVGSTGNIVCLGAYSFSGGTLNINNDVTLTVGSFSSSSSTTRTIAFGTAGSISITGNAATIWNTATTTNFTYTGTPTINFTYSGSVGTRTVSNGAGTVSFPFAFTGSDILSISGSFSNTLDLSSYTGTLNIGTTTFTQDLVIPSTVTNGTNAGTATFSAATASLTSSGTGTAAFSISVPAGTTLTLGTALTTTGTLTLNSGASSFATFNMDSKAVNIGPLVVSGSTTSPVIQAGTINCTTFTQNVGIQIGTGYNIVCSGAYSCASGTLTINDGVELVAGTFTSASTGSTKGIAFGTGSMRLTGTGTSETIFNTATGTSFFAFSGSKNVVINNVSTNVVTVTINTVGLTTSQILNFSLISGSYSLTIANGSNINALDFTGFNGDYVTGTSTNVFGDLTLYSGLTCDAQYSATNQFTMQGSTDSYIYPNGFNPSGTSSLGITVDKSSAIVYLGDDFDAGRSSYGFNISSGTFDTNNYNLTTSNMLSSGAATRSIILGSSTVTMLAGSFSLDGTNLTFSAGTSTIILACEYGFNFDGGGYTFYNLEITTLVGGPLTNAGSVVITGNNTFNRLSNSNTAAPFTLTLPQSGTTTILSDFAISGTSGNQVTLQSSTSGTVSVLTKSSGTVTVNYVSIKDSAAIGGATWRAPTNYGNINNGNVSGWSFLAVVAQSASNFFAFF